MAQSFAEENNLIFYETSAKNDINVNEVFVALARKVPLQRPRTENDDIFNFNEANSSNNNYNNSNNSQRKGNRSQNNKNMGGGGGGGCGCA